MAKGEKLDITFSSFSEGWEAEQICKKCGESGSGCTCESETEILPPSRHRLIYKKEKRRGKIVTLAGVFHIEKYEATRLLKRLKKALGCGGTFKDGWMEFQGENIQKLRALLEKEGFTP